jgi:6-phosphofructokinase 1
MKTLAVLTSGGDAPGMNAVIRAVVRMGLGRGWRVIGFRRGYEGIIEGRFQELGARDVSNILQRGGTILKTARSKAFLTLAGRKRAALHLERQNVTGLAVIGGDGTFRGAMDLVKTWRGGVVGIPGTIDNDLYGTDFTIGFDTAVNTAVEAIDKVRDTADAHERFFLIEVMGRNAGHLAVAIGLATGAEEVLIPEIPVDIRAICKRLCKGRCSGKTSSLIVVAEGAIKGGAYVVAEKLKKLSRNEYRVCILGHLQRGGSPSASDRLLGSRLGTSAVKAILAGKTGCMVGEVGGRTIFTPFRTAISRKKGIDPFFEKHLRSLNI